MANKNNSEGIAGYGKSTKEPYKNQTGANGVPVSEDGSKNIIQVIVGNNGTVMSTSWVPVGTNSNSQGGGSIQQTPVPILTQEPAPSAAPNPNVPDWVITNCSGSWPTIQNDNTVKPNSVVKGNIYTYDGNYYVASQDQAIDKNNYWKPSDNKGWLAVKIENTNPVYTVNDLIPNPENPTQKHIDVKQGDIFKYSDTEIYIRQYTSQFKIIFNHLLNSWQVVFFILNMVEYCLYGGIYDDHNTYCNYSLYCELYTSSTKAKE